MHRSRYPFLSSTGIVAQSPDHGNYDLFSVVGYSQQALYGLTILRCRK
ncbi:MAG: hypothetical protein WB762_09200 [Candidatus Sulfotelmatobacter sp.]